MLTVATFPALSEDTIYPKEQRMLEIVRDELADNRPVIIYCEQTRKRDLQPRLKNLIEQHIPQAKVEILRSETVSQTEKREAWLKAKAKANMNVLICNPGLVQVGLDLIHFAHIIVYEISYDLRRLLQACHRHWRLGQTKDCKTSFLFYQGTVEAVATRLVARKKQAADLLEGELEAGGLNDEADVDDLSHELAKAIAESTEDDGVFTVDAGSLFKATDAENSEQADSHFAAFDDEAGIEQPVTPLKNVIGQTYHDGTGQVQIVAYGPITETTYRVRANYGDKQIHLVDAKDVLAYLDGYKPVSAAPLLRWVEKPAAPAPGSAAQKPVVANKPVVQKPLPAASGLPLKQHEVSPVMWQYTRLKASNPSAVLLFEMGSFLQAYEADADIIAQAIDKAVTSNGDGTKMTAIPKHKAQPVINKLVEGGHRVAVATAVAGLPVHGLKPRKVTATYALEDTQLAAEKAAHLRKVVADLRHKLESHKALLQRGAKGLMPAVVQAPDGTWYALGEDATLFGLYGLGRVVDKQLRLITDEKDVTSHLHSIKQEVALINGQVAIWNPKHKQARVVEPEPQSEDETQYARAS